ncbi:hypothetical protein AB8A31_13170 [Tardiphaga sp. 804_B3_N1_9]|jgi:cyclopropane fatty-acyl-phospholipid synthase-like methyltransferase|uniref:hypothetical protein n=1 Tax=Tardiphaga TaxID=1395974 RepID=UPI001586078A|nr:hypothetical protein [Tardiphaga robiniae]NUU43478.1 hypothetical protein [Tardiphaga robiniae]
MAQPRDKKRSDTAGISDVTGNFQLKPGAICRVFRKDLFVEPFVEKEWRWSGTRYARMANDWLDNFDRHRDEIERILRLVHERNSAYGRGAGRWLSATAGLFVHADGSKWGVSHYRTAAVN